ncbi:MAG: ABC transporter ATP-binding protein [Mariprofundaceae bacterium]|nr:ABC transporter ATP-binding protein [Mariprofundaceae bacterium]
MMIQFNDVDKEYPSELGENNVFPALSQVSFQLEEGQSLGMIGSNGAGKSTCIRLMMGFMKHSAGSVAVFGSSPHSSQHRNIGYLPEVTAFPQNLKCIELLRFAAKTCAMPKKEVEASIEYWLTRLGLWDVRFRLLRNFSKGMQQRASFAMALVHDPKLLILDEPMSGLDPVGRMEIVALIQELREKGKSILFCSHVLDDVEKLVDQVLILHQGKVCFQGSVSELCQSQADWLVVGQDLQQHRFSSREELSVYMQENADNIKLVKHHEDFESAFLRTVKESVAI